MEEYVYFVDTFKNIKIELFYVFYEVDEFAFHTPIKEEDVKNYKLNVLQIDEFTTFGRDINDLLSMQFCDKVSRLIDKLTICD